MKTVEYISPEGEVVEVPEADATHFDAIGWERAAGNDKNANKKQTKK